MAEKMLTGMLDKPDHPDLRNRLSCENSERTVVFLCYSINVTYKGCRGKRVSVLIDFSGYDYSFDWTQ